MQSADEQAEVPSPIDFHDLAQAGTWVGRLRTNAGTRHLDGHAWPLPS